VGFENTAVHSGGQPEIIGVDDQSSHPESVAAKVRRRRSTPMLPENYAGNKRSDFGEVANFCGKVWHPADIEIPRTYS
jgi:hypothetical protein